MDPTWYLFRKEELADLRLQVFARLSLAQFINLDHAQA
jgi:hypothetical protein